VTVPLCIIQAGFWLSYLDGSHLIQKQFMAITDKYAHSPIAFWLMGMTVLTAGSIFLMWLGEQIDEYGLGNGVSLLILAGIVSRMPAAIGMLATETNLNAGTPDPSRPIGIGQVVLLILSFTFVVAGSILITQAQRRIPIQQAKHTRGRRVYGGSRQFLPLRVNHGGVMPIIFAQSLMLFPQMIVPYLAKWFPNQFFLFLNNELSRGAFFYLLFEAAMIYFFAYFWTTVQFQPKEMANQLRDFGSFIPGLRPGKRTSDYLEKVMMRITYVGAAFLCVIAVIPTALTTWMGIPFQITAFLGGTGLLIVVSVALDMVQRIEANLLMRNYGGFLGGEGSGKRIKGRQY
jgi:preprotein translocase subunit SecY